MKAHAAKGNGAARPADRSTMAAASTGTEPGAAMRTNQTVVHLNIGRMTIQGVSHGDHQRMRRAMEREFSRLAVTARNMDWRSASSVERMDPRTFPAGASAEEIGRHLAAEIFRELRRSR